MKLATTHGIRFFVGRSAWIQVLVVVSILSVFGCTDVQQDKQSSPTLTPLSSVRAISSDHGHMCALLGDNTIKCWGSNSNGQLGDGTTTDSRTPISVSGLSSVTAISTGYGHTCALLADRTIKCWGWNGEGQLIGQGQLGDGTTTDRSTPVSVSGLSSVTAISIPPQGRHTCALLGDNTMKCWGMNYFGQLGDGTTTDRSTPVSVSGLSSVRAISTGTAHTCALLADNTIKCWGENSSGQLGDGTTTDSFTPVSVSGLSSVTAISAGGYHTCALLADRTIKCWGWNGQGQLGDGTTTDRNIPVSVSGLSSVTAISSGHGSACALLADNTIKCWGNSWF